MSVLNDARQRLSYLLGESSQPTSTSEVSMRDQFINDTIMDIYFRTEWDWAKSQVTLPAVNGIVSLPSAVRQEGIKDLREIQYGGAGTPDRIYKQVEYREFDSYDLNSSVFRLTGNAESGNYLAQISISTASMVQLQYVTKPPILALVSDTYPIPNGAMVVAKGALMLYRMQQDPQADVTPEENSFEKSILTLMQMENRDRPIKRAITISEYLGYPGTGGLPKRF